MTAKLFKTRKLAEKYIRENYPDKDTEKSAVSSDSAWEAIDMPGYSWQGETLALSVVDNNGNEIERVGWNEEGTDSYELYVGGRKISDYDNILDAREAYNLAKRIEDEKDEDEEEAFEVKLYCNGEDISQ